MSTVTVTVTVVGVPGHRRVRLFRDAAVAAGLPEPAVVSWRDVCAGDFDLDAGGTGDGRAWVRLESPGEDAEIDRLLRGAAVPAAHGEIVGLAAWHRGLVAAARRVEARGVPLLTAVDELDVMFDKRRCHALLRSRGVAVPEAFAAGGYEEIRDRGREQGWRRVFVKPPHGSSASGVVALAFGGERGGGRVSAYTSAVLDGDRLYNELRVRHHTDERTVATIIDRLAAESRVLPAVSGALPAERGALHVERGVLPAVSGILPAERGGLPAVSGALHVERGALPAVNGALHVERGVLPAVSGALPVERGVLPAERGALHVERWLPKASHDGLTFDLRVLVVAGRVSHVVVRTGRSPMTNLHLGNARGDLAGVRAAVGEEHWAAAMRTCEAAAACFPGSLHAGVDLMFARDHRTHAVAEVNAFGDLLPGLLAGGHDTYAAEIDALLTGRFRAAEPAADHTAAVVAAR
ncbi:STM4014 family protein [Dactylosporangium siamense]|uniref:ATP-grasp domain-containing protein n=1 Tax=Dactylosporangium siamense TaxID=685454 RepID=A0A919UF12_9ACTN|nr:STM4014 family protein [Dactylosporangium siamense]GIG48178.1 hypothetical protein Dsi01nite_062190 [Dactylosporangium siamense]